MTLPDSNGGPLLFLSHAGADTEAARRLKARLEAAGLRVWFDKDNLRAGEKWRPQLEEAISRRATAFAVYIGSRGVVNWVEAEVDLALSRAISGEGHFPFIPILAAGADGSGALPGFARQFQGVRNVESNPDEFQKLVAAVLGKDKAGTLVLEKEPFFGLKAIDETRSHLFFGRERETQELVDRLAATRLLMVTGDSGSGKSSLVRAGLVPRWRGGALAELKGQRANAEIWHVVEARPRANPRRALGEAVNDAAQRLGRDLSDRSTLIEWAINGDCEKVRHALRCDLPADRTRTLLVIDQFEELWTLTPPEQRQPFVDLLLGLADPKDDAFAIVLTMRRDYYNLTSEFPALHNRLEEHDRQARYLLGRMLDEDLRRIVTEPLKLAGVNAGEREALAQAVLKDVGTRPGALALVQFALTETWRLRGKYSGDLLQAYVSSEIGRVEGALARAAERIYEQVLRPEYSESDIEAVFIRLVRLGDTGGASRRLARRREFDDRRWTMVQTLAREEGNRLVLISGAEGDERAEIAHEALVTQLPRFQRWLQAAAANKRTLDALIDRTASWVSAHDEKAKKDRLATGADRELFSQLATGHPDWLSADEKVFVRSSEKQHKDLVEADQRRTYRTRVAAVAFATLFVIASLIGTYANWQRNVARTNAKEAISQRNLAELERDRAELAFKAAKQSVDSLIFDIAQGLKDVSGMRAESVRRILETVNKSVESLALAIPGDRDLQSSIAAMQDNSGSIYERTNDLAMALQAYEKGLQIRRQLSASDPANTERRRDISVSLSKIGNVKLGLNDPLGALQAHDEAVKIQRELVASSQDNYGWRHDLSVSLNNSGNAKFTSNDLDGALADYEQGLKIQRSLMQLDKGGSHELKRDLSVSLNNIGSAKYSLNDLVGAGSAYEESLQLRRQLFEADPANSGWKRDLAVGLNNVGKIRSSSNDLAGAHLAYEESLRLQRELVNSDPGNIEWKRDLSENLNLFGNLMLSMNNQASALSAYEEIVDIHRDLASLKPSDPGWKIDLIISLKVLASESNNLVRKLALLEEALGVAQGLDASGTLKSGQQVSHEDLEAEIAKLRSRDCCGLRCS
ncbi:TIR domain-containing protein [Microvirga sp. BSC39]|uniref:nSTAND1 domain-containing NTPase n=1 Tax=Microvirga sp. BSC39 TaxID=1549810 RepID=UPI0004E89F21|nr:TIR domain-containing protein [Microvirga sp. BSC39]KFG69399.1 hypothetical protein JH26_11315 [Microvirga sp. BSC39]